MAGKQPESDGRGQEARNDLVLSFLSVRRALGTLGLFLPLALLAYAAAFGGGLLFSISDYFYSPMREIFTGTLCALAVFLWNYEGYRRDPGQVISDKLVSRIASTGALLVALAPISPGTADPHAPDIAREATLVQQALGPQAAQYLHFIGATAFFGALAVYCLVLFTRSDKAEPGPQKCAENRVYRICGTMILACMALIALAIWTGINRSALSPVFWLETLACFAFATSWMVKGKSLKALTRRM